MKLNLDDFKETLPYASELFGVYQPLLGWRSQIISRRIEKGRTAAFVELTERALSQVKPPASLAGVPEGALGLSVLRDPLVLEIAPVLDSCVARHLVGSLRDTDHINWKAILAPTSLNALLKASRDDIDHFYAGNKAEVSPLVLP